MALRLGISLRREWVDPILEREPSLPALEVIFEQWVFASEPALRKLERLRESHPLLLHCLSMNIGSSDPLDLDYFQRVRAFADRFSIEVVSDHLSWRSIEGEWSLSLLPLPRTEQALFHVLSRVDAAQSVLGRALALENVSQYLRVPGDIPLAEMFNQLHRRTGALLHLDLNNLLVTERWLGETAADFFDALTAGVAFVHVAGHEEASLPLDDHSRMPSTDCMSLLARVDPSAPVILEWDRERPPFPELLTAVSAAEVEYG